MVEQIYGLILVEVTKSSALQDRIVLQPLRRYLAIMDITAGQVPPQKHDALG